jgi:hypothetical protein
MVDSLEFVVLRVVTFQAFGMSVGQRLKDLLV